MKLPVASLTLLALLSAFARADNANESRKLDGTWKVVEAEKQGAKLPEKETMTLKVIIKEGKITIKDPDGDVDARLKVDATKKPAAIDFVHGKDEKMAALGIYEFDGSKLKICWSIDGAQRPKEFASSKESRTHLFVLTREK
jgi:uncharacterized protein (TIGR03067 family)